MGTTRTSGWAVFWFMAGFMVLVTGIAGAGALGLIAGAAMLIGSAVLFRSARTKEEA